MDAGIRFVSNKPLFLEFDQNNSYVTSANIRAYQFKGSCSQTAGNVTVRIDSQSKSIPCTSGIFSTQFDVTGAIDGSEILLKAEQVGVDNKILSDEKKITVDLTAPTLTFAVPDNASNYPMSSLKSHYPLSGTCSDPFNVVNVSSSAELNFTAICSANRTWTVYLDLSSTTVTSIDFYAKHYDAAGNISATVAQVIQSPQWNRLGPAVSATGVSSFRLVTPYGDTGQILFAAPLRNDDLVDVGIVNFDGTGLTRISPSFGSWGIDQSKPLTAVPKYGRVLYMSYTMGRVQLRELHSTKIDGTGDKILMGASAANPVGGLTTYSLTPDQETIIAIADLEANDNEFHLYTIKVSTGEIKKISGSLINGGDVKDFTLSPDGTQVIFRADKDIDETIELYAVKLDGTNLRKLNNPFVAGKSVQADYKISPDGNWVSYRDNSLVASGTDLFISSLNSSQVIKITNSVFSGASDALWSPDSQEIALRAEIDSTGCLGLYVYNIASANRKIISTACDASYKDTQTYVWSNDSTKIAFGNATINTRLDLWIANRDGTEKIHLVTTTANWNGVYSGYKENSIRITPDNQYVVFQADLRGIANSTASGMRFSLYSIKADGTGSPVMLHSDPVNTAVRDFPLINMNTDGSRVVFTGDLEVDNIYELYASSIDGSNQRKISPAIPNQFGAVYSGTQQYFYDWTHNSVTYLADTTIDSVAELYISDIGVAATAPRQIRLPTVLTGDYNNFYRSNNGQTVLYRANPIVDAEMHLYASNGDGSNMHRVSKDYVAGGGVLKAYATSNDGSKIAYIADQDTAGMPELYIADAAGGTPLKINTPILFAGGSVTEFAFADSLGKIFYRAYTANKAHSDLYSVNYDGTGTTVLTTYIAAGDILSWSLAPDNSYLAVRGDVLVDATNEIATLPIGGGTFTRINPLANNSATGFKISPDSAWICSWGVFSGSAPEARVYNVAAATRYTMVAGISSAQGTTACEFTPDSAYAVITGDWLTDGKSMLKTFKLADQTLTTLSATLPATSNTSWFSYINNGATKRVITLSETTPEIYEIYSQNFDATDFKKISQAPYTGGQVNANFGSAARILDDANNSIIYSGLIDRLGRWDLYSVRWDGSSPQKIISLNSYADIYDFTIVPGTDTIMFRADNDKDNVLNLYTVKADGSALKNHTPGLTYGTSANESTITPTHVIFRSDAYRNQVYEIFANPL